MYWVQALTQVRVINVVSTLFMISRGLNLSQIFLTTIVYSVVAVLFELPSSYLADKWSRKGLIIISILFGTLYWIFNMFAYGFPAFVITIGLFSISYSLISGTDEALIYDTNRELGQEKYSLKMLGGFHASGRFFKIFTPILAVLIASNLSNIQFQILIAIDLIANLIALILAFFMTEPKHIQNNEVIKKGVLKDTINLFKNNQSLINITINRTFIFLAGFSIWRISSEYLMEMGSKLIIIGVSTSFYQIVSFVINIKSHIWFKKWKSEMVINYINIIFTYLLVIFLVNEIFLKNWIIAIVIFILLLIFESARNPFFSDLINKNTNSYNRATTISGSSLVTELIKLPGLLLFSWLIYYGYSYLFGATLILAIITTNLFSLKYEKNIY
jgi:MFS family permease